MQAKSRLYGRRIRGDIGPIGIDPKTRLPGRILAPAVSLTGADQYYDEESDVPNFTIGSRMQVDDRVFYYSQAVAALAYPQQYHMVVSTDQVLAINDMRSTTATTVLGRAVTLEDGPAGAFPAFAADDLVGGYVECNSAGQYAWRRIVSNTAYLGTPGTVTITVDRPFGYIFPIDSQFSIHYSIYKNVDSCAHAGLVGFAPVIGVPPIAVQIAYFFWLQTYGPCWIGPTGAFPLSVANFYDVYFHQDGTTNSSVGEVIGTTVSPQRIGHVMGSGAYGSGAVFLELSA